MEHPGFVMRLVIDGDSIKFEPDFKDFEIVLINVYDVMLKAVTIVPRVETKLYSEWVRKRWKLPSYGLLFYLVCACKVFIPYIYYSRLVIRRPL